MSLKGIEIHKLSCGFLFYINEFSDELQDLISTNLASIFHGAAEVEGWPEYYSYKKTLEAFLDRYDAKDENTKKGMIAELLTHILIGKYLQAIQCISIFKNKEERSIKKGFDIIYFDPEKKHFWYSEVKSGNSSEDDSSAYNAVLLKRAKEGILEIFTSNRDSLWQSAMSDANHSVRLATRKDLKKLLSMDAPEIGIPPTKKNVMLISVLYHQLIDRILKDSLEEFHKKTVEEKDFVDLMILSIQKATFIKVENFIRNELKKL